MPCFLNHDWKVKGKTYFLCLVEHPYHSLQTDDPTYLCLKTPRLNCWRQKRNNTFWGPHHLKTQKVPSKVAYLVSMAKRNVKNKNETNTLDLLITVWQAFFKNFCPSTARLEEFVKPITQSTMQLFLHLLSLCKVIRLFSIRSSWVWHYVLVLRQMKISRNGTIELVKHNRRVFFQRIKKKRIF